MPGIVFDPIEFDFVHFDFRIGFAIVSFFDWLLISVPGESVSAEEDARARVFEPESSEDEKRRTRSKSLRKRAMNASAKFGSTLRKQSSRVADCRFAPISADEIRDAGEEDSVNKFREILIARDLLPPRHDDYHTMLR